ncbi:MAG: DUF58 domain-containing protein [Chloroflexi bacterium]|nr:DUF58 domain-containing protein [Chloroflexota bacterium]
MSDEMRRIRRQMRGPDAHEARSAMQASGRQEKSGIRQQIGQLPGFFGYGRRTRDMQVQEQFSEAWFAMALLFTLGGLIWKLDGLLLMAALLVAIIIASWAWNQLATFGLDYERHFSLRRAFVGETVELKLTVSNRKFLPVSWLRVADIFPLQLPLIDRNVAKRGDTNQGEFSTFWSLKWFQRLSRSYQLQAAERGFFRFGPAQIETGDLFGLFRTTHVWPQEDILIVYPQIVPLVDLGLPAKEPFGDLKSAQFMFADPIRTVGVRDYHPEDDFRRLHWKATARRQKLQTRVLEPATSHNLIVALNVATLAQHWRGVIPQVLEQAISVAASVAYYSVQQRWSTGLLANGALPRSDQSIKVPPGRAPGQMTAILEMLAAVTPFATAPIERLLLTESPHLPWGSTLVLVTPIITDDIAAALLDLKRMGRRLALISLDPAPLPPALRHMLAYRVPLGDMPELDLSQPISGLESVLSPQQRQQQTIHQAGVALRPPQS